MEPIEKHAAGVDQDNDLSFEQLTFGGDNHDQDRNGGRQVPKLKNKDKFRKKTNGNKKDGAPHTPDGEKSSSVYISTQEERLEVQPLLKKLEQFGAVRGYYFKEKQNFGIVQFVDPSVVDAVIENFNSADLGYHVTVERTARAKDMHASPHSFGSMPANTPSLASPMPSTPPPPEKPDTILVLKNLPFTLKQDQLHEILLSLSTTIPQSISLHYDNAGVFRGMAFIKYRQIEDAIQVYELLNGMDVGGRKVRVEYKRKAANATTPRGTTIPAITELPLEWQEDEELRKLWEQLSHFKEDNTQSEWYYPSTLTNNQKRNIYNMCEKLKLVQGTAGDSEVRVQYLTKKVQSSPHMEHSGSVDSKRGIDIKGSRRPRRDSDTNRTGGSPGSVELRGGRNSLGNRAEASKQHVSSSAPSDMNLDWRYQPNQGQSQGHSQGHTPTQSHSQSHGPSHTQAPQTQQSSLVTPVRQPRGPDGSKGFADQYRTARKLTLNTTCAFLATVAV